MGPDHIALVWRAVPKHTPVVHRRCSRCNTRTEFVSSDKFRINGSGRKLDVWLIYKCTLCNQTWNSTILTRVSPESIGAELYQAMLDNDAATAWRYAFDLEILKRNQVEADPNVAYEIEGEHPELGTAKSLELKLDVPLPINARLDTLLSQQLGIARKRLHALFEQGALRVEPDPKAKLERRIRKDVRVTIDLDALRALETAEAQR